MRLGVWAALAASLCAGTALSQTGGTPGRFQNPDIYLTAPEDTSDHDPYIWLSKNTPKSLDWVKDQDATSNAQLLGDPLYKPIREQLLASLDTRDRIPLGEIHHGEVYNFWQDGAHVRGLWRRTSVADYREPNPDWEILLDVDKYDAETHKNWVFHGGNCNPSTKRCLVDLSPGGGDAGEIVEFDPATHSFPADGFQLAVAKSNATYLDDDTIVFDTDFGPGSLTKSGYPRIVKIWHRGAAIADAKTVFEGTPDNIQVGARVSRGPYGTIALIQRGLTTFTSEHYALAPDDTTIKIPLPLKVQINGITQGQLVFTSRDDWSADGHNYKQGSLLAFDMLAFMKTKTMGPISVLYVPDEHGTVESVSSGRDAVYAAVFENIVGSIHAFRPGANGQWTDTILPLPAGGSTATVSADAWSPEAHFTYESFLVPPTLYETFGDGRVTAIRSQKPIFDASKVTAQQFWATSADGTKIPYFIVRPKDTHGPLPTIQYGYGGFQLSNFPWYWNDGHKPLDAGQAWIGRGGAIVVANIRGGGEFGPAWHEATRLLNHQHAFDDFAAVAQDLIARKFTTPDMLGIVGASNGGLLVTATMTEHPELFRAVVCQRPLVDMLRYTRFGAGASWVGEYGDPDKDPAIRAYIEKYSAYQNVKPDVKMPSILFITETSDDRVTPVFARMMAAKMEAQGHDVLFNEAPEGGHGPGSTNAEQADMWALSYTYFAEKLGLGK